LNTPLNTIWIATQAKYVLLPKVFLQYSSIIFFCLLSTIFLPFIGITFFLIRLALSRDILKLTNSPQELFTLFKRIFVLFNILDDIPYSLKSAIFIQCLMIFLQYSITSSVNSLKNGCPPYWAKRIVCPLVLTSMALQRLKLS